MIYIVSSIFILIVIIIIIAYYYTSYERASDQGSASIPDASYKFTSFFNPTPFNYNELTYQAQSQAWKQKMQQIANRLDSQGVATLCLVHGTFVGQDPFELVRLLSSNLGQSNPKISSKIISILGRKKDSLIKDNGTFTKEYEEILQSALSPSINVKRFLWSSGNHHIARVEASLELLAFLVPMVQKDKSIVLVGHSHAGQLFALLTVFMDSSRLAKSILKIAVKSKDQYKSINKQLRTLKKAKIHFVTLGAPPRYPWKLSKNHDLLHLINHRGKLPIAGTFSGALGTRDGDYIQQWGVAGSDSLSAIKEQARLNKQLEPYLGAGLRPKLWQRNIKKRQRLHQWGQNLLIDYQDNALTINSVKTLFGHGIYTKYLSILYNFDIISQHICKHPLTPK